jgi:2-dehydro-3-deoxyphosphooctonate aldolase (KDO 8-P synthase)
MRGKIKRDMMTRIKEYELDKYFPGIAKSSFNSFFLMAGPCVVEDREILMETAERIRAIAGKLEIPLIFKSSYRKANRSRIDSFSGIGDMKALELLAEVRNNFQIPVITDIHSVQDADLAATYVDVLQIPAFLCRQTDILVAAARTGKTVAIKKGQFLSAEAMQFAIEKVREAGSDKVLVTERGSMFGYQDLVIDYRGIPLMQSFNVPVILDITHSLQQPNQPSGISGGKPELIETVAMAGIAAGVDGIFLETHPDPKSAKSDGANMLHLDLLEDLLFKLVELRKTILTF